MRATTVTTHSLTATALGEVAPDGSLHRVASRQGGAVVSVLLALTLVAARPAVVAANPGDLDPSFGTGGKVTTAFGTSYARADAVALQDDGKIVAAGFMNTSAGGAFELARYNVDGGLDATFGTGGTVTTAIGTFNDSAHAVAVQGDGKIVVAGDTDTGTQNILGGDQTVFALARYKPDGSLDATFGTRGTVTTAFGTIDDHARAIVLQGDGKIVVAGGTLTACDLNTGLCERAFALTRYNPDGSLDATFGTRGMVMTAFGTSNAGANAVALQGDGKLVVAGYTETNNFAFALARYNPNGSLDATFGAGGTVTTAALIAARAVALQGDGKIVAAGSTETTQYLHERDFAVGRYDANGSLDATFGTGGTVITAFGDLADASAVVLQRDGEIVVVGDAVTGHDPVTGAGEISFALARYNPDGSLDATFGAGGTVTTAFGVPSEAFAPAAVLQGDGKIVVAGGTTTDPVNFISGFALARYLNDTTATTSTTTSTSTTSTTPRTTTTITLRCTTARCTLAAALMSSVCAGETIPASVTGKLTTAETLIDQAATTPGKKARKVRQKAKNLLRQAAAKATRAAKGKRAKLSASCAAALKGAAALVAAKL